MISALKPRFCGAHRERLVEPLPPLPLIADDLSSATVSAFFQHAKKIRALINKPHSRIVATSRPLRTSHFDELSW
jgi:hypothetical protein